MLQAKVRENTQMKGSEPERCGATLSLLPGIRLRGRDILIILFAHSPSISGPERPLERGRWAFPARGRDGGLSVPTPLFPSPRLLLVSLQCSDTLEIGFPLVVASLSKSQSPTSRQGGSQGQAQGTHLPSKSSPPPIPAEEAWGLSLKVKFSVSALPWPTPRSPEIRH